MSNRARGAARSCRLAIGGLFTALLLSPVLPEAATPCFKPAEIEAEQAIRFQTELMVLSDSCDADIYPRFTQRNRRAIAAYQQLMIEHFRRLGSGHAEASFDSYMTKLANEVSLRNGREPLATLCGNAGAFLASADHFGENDFRRYVAEQAAERRPDYRSCTE